MVQSSIVSSLCTHLIGTCFAHYTCTSGITTVVKLEKNFKKSKYGIEKVDDILPEDTLQNVNLTATLSSTESGKLVIYNPDKWKKVTFSEARPKKENNIRCFEILHISTQ